MRGRGRAGEARWTTGRGFLLVALGGVGLASAGCSISVSSASISDSISGSSKSFSDSVSSSSPDDSSKSEHAFREDVRDYTAAAARAGQSPAELESGLTAVAERHGVTNWEADDATYVGIGEGLSRAGVDAGAVSRWVHELGGSDADGERAGRLIRRGYDADRS